MKVQSKNALPTEGYLTIDFTFHILEWKRLGYTSDKAFSSEGQSKVFNNVRAEYPKMKINAIYNGVKKAFPTGTVTPVRVIIYSYEFIYYLDRYQYVNRNGKEYERYRDKEAKRTRYYRPDTHLLDPNQDVVFDGRR